MSSAIKTFRGNKLIGFNFRIALIHYKLRDKDPVPKKFSTKNHFTEDEVRAMIARAIKAGTVTYLSDIRPIKE